TADAVHEEERGLRTARLKRHDRRPGRRAAAVHEKPGLLFNRALLQETRKRKPDAEMILNLRDQAHSHQRVPADVEEIVVDAKPAQPEHLFPDSRELGFNLGP